MPRPAHISGLKLKYCLECLKGVKGKILEVGCGAGGFARGIKRARPDLEVWGVDIDKRAIGQAKKCLKGLRGLRFKVGDAHSLDFSDQGFSAVVMADILEHLEKPPKAISEAYRVLKTGGVLFLAVPLEGERHSLVNLLSRLGLKSKEKLTGHCQSFKRKKLVELLEKSGFKIEKIRYSTFFLGQSVDILFYIMTDLLGRLGKLGELGGVGLEEWLGQEKSLPRRILALGKKILASLVYFESRLFSRLPFGGEISVKAVKSD